VLAERQASDSRLEVLVGQPAAITLSGRSFLCGHELQLPELPLPLPLTPLKK
jgi:hypothetical protein